MMGVALDKKDIRLVKTINQLKDVNFELNQAKAELRKCKEDRAREQNETKDLLDKCRRELHRACKTKLGVSRRHFYNVYM